MKRPLRGALSAFALLTGLALTISSCGFGGNKSDSSDPKTLSFLVPSYSDGTKSEWDSIIADFHRQNPDITVNLQVESWTQIPDVVRTDLQSESSTPDILNIDAYSTYASDGKLYPADQIVDNSVLSDLQPSFVKNASINGTQWALPLFASTRTLFYNTDLFAKAGITAPPKTWAELTDDAKKVAALGGGVYGYGLPLGKEETQAETSLWTFGAGGSWSDGNKITVDTPQNLEGVQALKAIADAGVTEPNPGSTNRTPLINVFIQGKIGMIEGLPPLINMIQQQNPGLKYATAPTPTKDGAPVTLGVADHLMAFKKKTDKTAAIKKFLDFFYQSKVYSTFVKAEHFIPVTTSGVQAMADDPVVKAFAATMPVAKFYPSNDPKWAAVEGAMKQQLGTVTQGADPATVLKAVQQAAS
ncbi:extracellular solute-binding protein [Nocardia terpenica]|uniref:extracellular solute-binding protein n=1 Tax=Nocardia terpenica TaxID=455432 RepID=UPI00189379D0|nr:extracellular solute-binding protein [Nocardia terpenica]MBF6060059.1 extracellular solute-binding protein [Nocardia terpenica]MBF6103319.1 extracellular solute-binding protein [Nocardia terpenica]MBF6112307.1 extracellular solute-binding protein [Nocardia terpenica]MBF6117540.1 extracellular solute-binding protein [Nocardia terpenica]MBF6157287.1 extracellular solute-binding protein [Nocardia terpenica]